MASVFFSCWKIALVALLFAVSAAGQSNAKRILVAVDGSGDFKTIQQAVDHIPDGNTRPTVIQIKPGVYHEQVRVNAGKRFITLRGDDAKKTVITYRLSAQQALNHGRPFN